MAPYSMDLRTRVLADVEAFFGAQSPGPATGPATTDGDGP